MYEIHNRIMIKNRIEAGQLLGKKIEGLKDNVLILAIPRGGVIVGHEIAKKVGCTLDVIISKKITPPGNPEFAIGAITHDATIFKGNNWDRFTKFPGFKDELNKKQNEVRQRLEMFRGGSEYQFNNKTVVLVDDGIATGSTVLAILIWLKKQKVKNVVLAVPVIPVDTYKILKNYVPTIIVIETPSNFSAVSQFYEEFEQVSDNEVLAILGRF